MARFGPVLLVALFPLALCAEDKKDEKKDEKKPVAFVSKEGKFSVTLPDKPLEKTAKVKVGDLDLDHHIFTVGQKDRAQLITYLDYTKEVIGADTDKFLSGAIERNTAFLKGKVVSDEKITFGKQKHPGRDIRIEYGGEKKQFYRARIVLAGNRLYQVVALGPDEFIKGKDADEYFKSFALEE
jgi:hypothetical protein